MSKELRIKNKKGSGHRSVLEQRVAASDPFFVYPKEIRKIIYTTDVIENLHMQLRKVLKKPGYFPSDAAATELIFLALRNITKKWKNPSLTWRLAATQLALQFSECFLRSKFENG